MDNPFRKRSRGRKWNFTAKLNHSKPKLFASSSPNGSSKDDQRIEESVSATEANNRSVNNVSINNEGIVDDFDKMLRNGFTFKGIRGTTIHLSEGGSGSSSVHYYVVEWTGTDQVSLVPVSLVNMKHPQEAMQYLATKVRY